MPLTKISPHTGGSLSPHLRLGTDGRIVEWLEDSIVFIRLFLRLLAMFVTSITLS